MVEAILRRQDFDPPERLQLFHELAEHFKMLVVYPAEATEALTDEQYVRNVVDILFRPQRPERQEILQAVSR